MEPDPIIISDYFGESENTLKKKEEENKINNNQETEAIKETNNSENENNKEEFSNDIKIVIQEKEKSSKIKIPEDIIKDKKRSNELTQIKPVKATKVTKVTI